MNPLTFRRAALAAVFAALGASQAALAAGGSSTGADIQLSGSASTSSPQAGTAMALTYHVRNSGPQNSTSAVFTNSLKSGYLYRSATVNGNVGLCRAVPDAAGGVTVTCDLGTIAKGSQADVVVNLDAPTVPGAFDIDASIASAVVDPNTRNNALLINVQVKSATAATTPGVLAGPIYIRESFGSDLFGNQSCACRLDASGAVVAITNAGINGLRAEVPNLSTEVWATPTPRQLPNWRFAVSSPDPAAVEPVGSLDGPGQNGTLVSDVNPSIESNNAALLPFVQPAGAVTLSTSLIAGWYTTAIGFSSSGVLVGNFETAGLAWFVVRMPRTTPGGAGAVATWELHTKGFSGPSASGTMVLGNYNHVAVSYDPVAGKVVASIEGVPVASVDYVVSGVAYVGFQGNGIVNDFLVKAGAIAAP